jgi:hypothetical protein
MRCPCSHTPSVRSCGSSVFWCRGQSPPAARISWISSNRCCHRSWSSALRVEGRSHPGITARASRYVGERLPSADRGPHGDIGQVPQASFGGPRRSIDQCGLVFVPDAWIFLRGDLQVVTDGSFRDTGRGRDLRCRRTLPVLPDKPGSGATRRASVMGFLRSPSAAQSASAQRSAAEET